MALYVTIYPLYISVVSHIVCIVVMGDSGPLRIALASSSNLCYAAACRALTEWRRLRPQHTNPIFNAKQNPTIVQPA